MPRTLHERNPGPRLLNSCRFHRRASASADNLLPYSSPRTLESISHIRSGRLGSGRTRLMLDWLASEYVRPPHAVLSRCALLLGATDAVSQSEPLRALP